MKVLVIGANGMAGHVVAKYLKQQNYNVHTVARSDADFHLDIENVSDVTQFFNNIDSYDYVINCIGLLVKDSNDRPDRAAIINSWFPHYVEQVLKNTATKLIHLSTDCVFDGSDGPYSEQAVHSERNAYGRSKSLGEINNAKDLTMFAVERWTKKDWLYVRDEFPGYPALSNKDVSLGKGDDVSVAVAQFSL
jgi:dTDP-4-dehydrorhamnose reductase